jgi:16S rRNA (guanine(527)-N(7))-methyltransferase RsmG
MESLDKIGEYLQRSGFPLKGEAITKLCRYVRLIKKWNSHVNLTASSEWPSIEPLLYEGIWASQGYPGDAKRHLDIGSGAGFPAIPIKIMVPHIQLDMVESRMKKVSFLETVASEINLTETHVFHSRIGELLDKDQNTWDSISWKALKISTSDLLKLKQHAHQETQFWVFHGKGSAVEEPAVLENNFSLLRREQFPLKKDWVLSVYLPR